MFLASVWKQKLAKYFTIFAREQAHLGLQYEVYQVANIEIRNSEFKKSIQFHV